MITATLQSYPGLKILLATVIGGVSYLAAENWTSGNLGIGLGCQAMATLGAAYLMKRDKVAAVRSSHELSLLDRVLQSQEESHKTLLDRTKQLNKLTTVLTIGQHSFAGENEGLREHVRLRGELLKENGIKFPEFRGRKFEQLVAEQDKIRADIFGLDPDFVDRIKEDGDVL